MSLSSKFYRYRSLVSDKLAACVFLEPSLCPSRDRLSRDIITDYGLLRVLALSIVCRRAEQVAIHLVRDEQLGPKYLARLLELLDSDFRKRDFALIGYVDLYVRELKRLELVERDLVESAVRCRSAAALASELVRYTGAFCLRDSQNP